MHRDFWHYGSIPNNRKSLPYIRENRESFKNIDNDTALILTLIMILKKENADPLLILALLYILT